MSPVYSLFSLDEPAYILNGRLCRPAKGPVQVLDSVDQGWDVPDDMVSALTFFTKLRTASEVRGLSAELEIDEDDVAALVKHQLLWRIDPQPFWAQAGLLAGLKIVQMPARAAEQNRPGLVLFALPDTMERVSPVDEFTATVLAEASRPPVVALGLAMQRIAADQQLLDQREHCWKRVGVGLAQLLRVGTAALSAEWFTVPFPWATADLQQRRNGDTISEQTAIR